MRRFPRPPPPRARVLPQKFCPSERIERVHTERNQHDRGPAARNRPGPAASEPAGYPEGGGRATGGWRCSLSRVLAGPIAHAISILLPRSLPQDRSESIASQGGSGGKPKGGAVVGKFRVADGAVRLLDSADVEQVKSAKVSEVSELLDPPK